MRWLLGSIASLLLVTLEIACNTVSPDECWPNTSGGFGGGGTIPIGTGVGATTGDYFSPPPVSARSRRGFYSHSRARSLMGIPAAPCDGPLGA
jgi:hypothetical protein